MIVLLAIINSLAASVMAIRWKKLRSNNISSKTSFGLLTLSLPLSIISILLIQLFTNQRLIPSWEYVYYVAGWICVCITTNVAGIYLMKHKSLSELTIYKLAASSVVAIVVDILILKANIGVLPALGAFILLASGFILPINKTEVKDNLKTGALISIILFLSILGTLQFTLYKQALSLQSSTLLHAFLAQSLLFMIFGIISFSDLKKDLKAKKVSYKDFLFFGMALYVLVVTESFLFRSLPITVLTLLAILSIIIYQIYDLKNKDLKHGWRLYASLGLASIAIILIQMK